MEVNVLALTFCPNCLKDDADDVICTLSFVFLL